jgi:hypothetical protein
LVPKERIAGPLEEKARPKEELDWWAKCSDGVIDPRPRVMAYVQKGFGRILGTGGAFIVFSDSRDEQDLVFASHQGGYGGFTIDQKISFDNWCFLSLFVALHITDDHGTEIARIDDNDDPLIRLLSEHIKGASFLCTFNPDHRLEKRWVPLLENKYGMTVAGAIVASPESEQGLVLLLPNLVNKGSFLVALLKDILPEVAPKLFPHAEGQRWVHRPEYELPAVMKKGKEIALVRETAAHKIAALEDEIAAEQASNQFHY